MIVRRIDGRAILSYAERLRGLEHHSQLEAALGFSFRDRALLELALAHSSYLNENPGVFPESNERLEFLGDALIGAIVADELYRRHPGWPEGELTDARSAVVRGETLAGVAARVELGRHLYMGRGEEAGGGRERPSNLAAVLEALVGALYLDQGYQAARDFILGVFSPELSTLGQRVVPKNPKSALQETVQAMGLDAPTYEIVDVSGADHSRRLTAEVKVDGRVLGRGTGARKSQAEGNAAAEALEALGEEE